MTHCRVYVLGLCLSCSPSLTIVGQMHLMGLHEEPLNSTLCSWFIIDIFNFYS